MSRIGMRNSDSDGQPQDSIHHQSQFSFSNYDITSNQQPHTNINNNHHNNRRRIQQRKPQSSDYDDVDDVKPEINKAFVCMQPGCPRTFSSRFKLVRHILIHSGERRFQCGSCGRRFHRKDHLKNHLQVHNPNKILHACDQCQKTYCSLLSYRKHIALHAAESGDLVCKLCGKVLADREGIMHHLKVHTGSRTLRGPSERKFPCDRCDRSFFTKKDVKRHLVVHTGKRDFVCQFCPQRFGRKDHLVRHTKKSHTGNSLHNNSPPNHNEAIRKFEPSTNLPPQMPHPSENHKPNSIAPITDIGLVITPTPVSPLMENTVLEPIKPDPTYGAVPTSNLMQSTYSINSLPTENGQSLSRFSDPPLLPVSQYLPMSPSYPTVTPLMPHHYLNMSSSSNILSDLLPPMSIASSFTTSLTLDMGNPPLPHFNQAFQ